MPRGSELLPRSRIVTLRPKQIEDLLRRGGLWDSPYDPRQALIVAGRAFLAWTVEEEAELGDEDWPSTDRAEWNAEFEEPLEPFPLRLPPPKDLSPESPMIDLGSSRDPIVLSVVTRRAHADAPAVHRVPATWDVVPRAVCCAYVQLELNGEATVLFEGWVGRDRLAQLAGHEVKSDDGSIRIESERLEPMASLWHLLHERARPVAPLGAGDPVPLWDMPTETDVVLAPAATSTAAEMVQSPEDLVSAPTAALSPQAPSHQGTDVAREAAQASSAPRRRRLRERFSRFNTLAMAGALALGFLVAMVWNPRAEQSPAERASSLMVLSLQEELTRGASRPPTRSGSNAPSVVQSGQRYSVKLRATGPTRQGWLFQVDSRAAYLIAVLPHQSHGNLTDSFQGTFDYATGYEYFVVVLADRPLPELGEKSGRVHWLKREEIERLQQCAHKGDDDGAAAVIRDVIRKLAPQGTRYEVEVYRVARGAP